MNVPGFPVPRVADSATSIECRLHSSLKLGNSHLVIGEVKEGIVTMDQQTIALQAEATNIPAQIEIDVTTLEVGQQITAGDLNLPEGAVFPGEADDLILSVAAPISAEALEASLETEGDEAAAEPTEGEGDEAAEDDAE